MIEFCSNGSIREYLKKIKRNGKRLSSDQIMYLVIKIVEALEVLHKQYVIHREYFLLNLVLSWKIYCLIRILTSESAISDCR